MDIVDGIQLQSFLFRNESNRLQPSDLYHRCMSNASGFQTVEFTYECFLFKLNDIKFVFLSLVFFFLIFIDIVTNLIIILSIMMEKNKKRVDVCFMSNAVADLVMGIVIMPFTAMYTLFGHFPFDNFVCFIWNCLDFTAGTVSMLHIAFISYDRYLSVSKPLKYTQSKSNSFSVTGLPTSLILAFIWVFSACAWVPAIMYIKSNDFYIPIYGSNNIFNVSLAGTNTVIFIENLPPLETENKALSECNVEASPSFVVPHSLLVYFFPMIIIFVFYSKTIFIVNHKMGPRRTSLITNGYSQSRLGSTSNVENISYIYPKSEIPENLQMSCENSSNENQNKTNDSNENSQNTR